MRVSDTRSRRRRSVRATCTTFSRPSANDKMVRALGKNQAPCGLAAADPPGLVELAAAVLAGVGGVDQQWTLPGARRGLDPLGAGDQRCPPRASRPSRSSALLAKRRLDPLAKVGGDVDVAGLERAGERALELALGIGLVERRRGRRRSRRRGPARGRGRRARPGRRAEREPDQLLPRRRPPR